MSFPTFHALSSTSGPLVVEVCPRAGARYLVWMESKDFTEEWKSKTRAKILAKEHELKSPLVIPVSISKDEPYTSDFYESDSEEDNTVDYDAEFDSQWMPSKMPKVDLTPYEQQKDRWISVIRRKKISPMKIEENLDLLLASQMQRNSPK